MRLPVWSAAPDISVARSGALDAYLPTKSHTFRAFDVGLALRVVFGAAGKIMDGAIYLDRNTGAPNGEIDRIAANVVLTHDVNAFLAQEPQRLPSTVFTRIHADASFGCFRARRMSQAPSASMVVTRQST